MRAVRSVLLAQLRNDSLIGVSDAGQFARPLGAISYVSVLRKNTPLTIAAVAAVGVAVGLLLYIGFFADHSQATY